MACLLVDQWVTSSPMLPMQHFAYAENLLFTDPPVTSSCGPPAPCRASAPHEGIRAVQPQDTTLTPSPCTTLTPESKAAAAAAEDTAPPGRCEAAASLAQAGPMASLPPGSRYVCCVISCFCLRCRLFPLKLARPQQMHFLSRIAKRRIFIITVVRKIMPSSVDNKQFLQFVAPLSPSPPA